MTIEGDYARLLQELRSRASSAEGPLSLVSFTIAGVQTFLDSARTTRDVWNGSYLMSYLMWKATEKALNEVLSRSGVSHPCSDTQRYVLIPAIEKQPFWQHWVYGTATNLDVAHFPNTVLLLVPGDAKAARGMAGQMELAVESAWNEICAACREPLRSLLGAGVAGELWKYQLEWRRGPDGAAWQQIFETYTSVCQVPADAGALNQLTERLGLDRERNPAGRLFQLSMRLLAARKALRDFEQVAHEGHRCSLCGSRSALANYPRRSDSKRSEAPLHFSAEALREFWQEVRKIKGLEYAFRDGERLCAVCIVRRLAPVCFFQKTFPAIKDRILFPSTSTIATAAWVRDVVRAAQLDDGVNVSLAAKRFPVDLRKWQRQLGIEDPPEALIPFFENIRQDLKGFAHCDGRWFYEETYAPEQLERDYGVDPGKLAAHPGPLPGLMKDLRDGHVQSAPDDYIAVILADGDRMGDWISGRHMREDFSLDWLGRLSAALACFANEVRHRLETKIPAKVVYAGGDDLLAFAPRACVMDALEILDTAFDECVRRRLGFTREQEPNPSLSVSCVLAKHNEPLRGLISRAHELLKQGAKERLGRNAFTIYRTTAGVEAGAPFYAGGSQTLGWLRCVLEALRTKLSPQVCYSLERLADGLKQWDDPEALEAARCHLIRRAFERHYDAPADCPESQKVRACAESLFRALCDWAKYKAGEAVDPFRSFIDLLGALGFLARHRS